jgi:hypothetical protein
MDKNLSIVLVDNRNHRVIAQENWGLTKRQMRGMHVHHRIKRSEGGTNDPSNLFVCSEWFHNNIWHSPEEYLSWARKGGLANKGVKKQQRGDRKLGRPSGTKDSLQTKLRKSEARKGEKNPRFGVVLSQTTKQKISNSQKGKRHSEERKQNQREKITGRKWWVNRHGETRLSAVSPGAEWTLGRVKPI